MKKVILSVLGLGLLLSSCKNSDKEFPDYIYQTISFAQQTPIRSLTLGEDGEFDVSLDNEHIFQICPVLGGINTNKKDRWAQLQVDPSLLNNMSFADGSEMRVLPESYYTLLSDSKVTIKKGQVLGYLDIKLQDAFFADPKAVDLCYVLPVRITSASDSILSGTPKVEGTMPSVVDASAWSVAPKSYTLYAIKYKNKWEGCWLSKSKVTTVNNGQTTEVVNTPQYWENAALKYLKSKSLTASHYQYSHAVPYVTADGGSAEKNLSIDLIVNIADDGNVTVTTETPGATASGSGKYTYHGEAKAWGNADRDKIEFNYTYTIPYVYNEQTGETAEYKVTAEETLVARDRQNKLETFSYVIR